MNQEVELNNINIKALWKILKKEKWIIIGITSLFTVSGGFIFIKRRI
jgi:capsular polysaccharide biosynthesis protein